MTPEEIKERGEQEAWDNYQSDICELEIDLREAAMKLFDKRCGDRLNDLPFHDAISGLKVLWGNGLEFSDYLRWKNPPTPDPDFPF